jgi:hypothetical protein
MDSSSRISVGPEHMSGEAVSIGGDESSNGCGNLVHERSAGSALPLEGAPEAQIAVSQPPDIAKGPVVIFGSSVAFG